MKIRNEKWIQLQAYPIKLENNFPSGQDQAEGFAGTSLPSNLSPLERKTPGRSTKPVS